MTYDTYGNITSKNGQTYFYENPAWHDLLTGIESESITYDAQGNPVNYLGHTLTWEKGRQLKSFDSNTYTYNANGIRTSKTINGVKHEYTLEGTKILRETWGNNTLIPLYDNEDGVCGIIYNGFAYYFLKNLQGDIISIANRKGKVVASYSYDAWGVCSIVSDSTGFIATVNPFRYRSYYFDQEIGLYYLQSRYYDPNVGRFINADNAKAISSKGLGCVGYNIFTYCQNNPINGLDVRGCCFVQVFAKIILGILLGIFTQLIFDVLDFLVRLISNPNAKFQATPIEYITSILSSIFSFFDIRNKLVRYILNLVLIVTPYVHRDFSKPETIFELITDLMFFFVGEIVGGALGSKKTKKIKIAKEKISKKKNKLTKAMKKAKQMKKEISIKQEFEVLGFAIGFTLNISNKLVNDIAGILIK